MKITEEQAEQIFFGDSDEFTMVEEGDWEDQGKHSDCEAIFKVTNPTEETEGKCYLFNVTREGSPYTDYEFYFYGVEDCPEVEKVETTTLVWEPVA